MRSSDLSEIRSLRLFRSMEDETFEAVMLAGYLQTLPAHVELICEGEHADFLHVVVDGCVELFAHANGRETTTGMVHPVNAFILAAVLKDAVYLMSARTAQRSKVLMIPARNIRNAFEKDAAFAHSIIDEMADSYRGLVKEHKELKLRTAVERLANQLMRFDCEQGGNGEVELPYDKRTLASLLSMTPENLSRAFNTLKPYGVRVNGGTVHLTDNDALAVLAKPNCLIDDPHA